MDKAMRRFRVLGSVMAALTAAMPCVSVAADAVIGKVDDSRSGHTAINGRLGTMVDYVFTRHEPGSPVQAVRRAGVVFGDGSTLSVYGRAPVASGAQMQATVQGILEGIGGAN